MKCHFLGILYLPKYLYKFIISLHLATMAIGSANPAEFALLILSHFLKFSMKMKYSGLKRWSKHSFHSFDQILSICCTVL